MTTTDAQAGSRASGDPLITSADPRAHPHAVGIPEAVKADLGRRLSRIRGQVDGLGRMVDEERYCPEVLQQFSAVRSALRSAEKVLLASHLEGCAARALGEGGAAGEQVRDEILDLFSRYMR